MDRDTLAALLPLALGHDQEATACPWVRLTGRTTDYPSRKAQAALAVASHALPITADLVDLLFRCDDCRRCEAASILPGPPDLARGLWQVRAALVAAGEVPEISPLAEAQHRFGNLYGDLGEAVASLGPNDPGAEILFVPGAATLFYTPDAAIAALPLIRAKHGGVDLHPDCLDSGQTLRELGLATHAEEVRTALRQRVADAGYRLVIAGTPKETFGLREALSGLPVDVQYAGSVLARSAGEPVAARRRSPQTLSIPSSMSLGEAVPVSPGRQPRAAAETPSTSPTSARAVGQFDGAVVLHPSETLLHRLDGFEAIDEWLTSLLGDRYRREPDPRHNAWPAATERPAVGMPDALARALAEQRLAQLQALARTGKTTDQDRLVILTCDPFSWQALRQVAPATIDVVDLMVFMARLAGEGK